jgi:biopolymer transport protein ExbD
MATSIAVDDGRPMSDLNTTPLIDVMLVLLIMLIITIPVMTHAININFSPSTSTAVPPPIINLAIDFDGTVSWNGEEVRDARKLNADLIGAAQKNPQPQLQVTANRYTKYDSVAKVLAMAQRDGIKAIGVAGFE